MGDKLDIGGHFYYKPCASKLVLNGREYNDFGIVYCNILAETYHIYCLTKKGVIVPILAQCATSSLYKSHETLLTVVGSKADNKFFGPNYTPHGEYIHEYILDAARRTIDYYSDEGLDFSSIDREVIFNLYNNSEYFRFVDSTGPEARPIPEGDDAC